MGNYVNNNKNCVAKITIPFKLLLLRKPAAPIDIMEMQSNNTISDDDSHSAECHLSHSLTNLFKGHSF